VYDSCESSDASVFPPEVESRQPSSADQDVLISRTLTVEKRKILKSMMLEISDLVGYGVDSISDDTISQRKGSIASVPSCSSSQRHASLSFSSSGKRSSGFHRLKESRRMLDSGNGDGREEEENPDRPNPDRKSFGAHAKSTGRRFACPYFVKYPESMRI
jgi:hypothetical protein